MNAIMNESAIAEIALGLRKGGSGESTGRAQRRDYCDVFVDHHLRDVLERSALQEGIINAR